MYVSIVAEKKLFAERISRFNGEAPPASIYPFSFRREHCHSVRGLNNSDHQSRVNKHYVLIVYNNGVFIYRS